MPVRFIQLPRDREWNSELPSVNNYCSAALTIDVVTKEREKVSHTRQRCVSQEEVSRGQNSCGRDHVELMQTRWIQKRSLFTTNVKAVGDTCVTAAHGARVCAISMINQNQKNATNSMRWCQFTCEWTGLNRGLAWQKHTLIGLIWLLQSHSCVHKHRFAPIKHDVILGRKSSICPLSTHTCTFDTSSKYTNST